MAKIKLALGLILLLSLLGSIFSTSPAVASPDVVKWSRVNLPTEGKVDNWVLAKGSDIQHLTQAIDGTLYGYANPSETSYTLFKSTDEGRSWSYTGEVKDDIIALATVPDDASIIYYATSSNIYKSTNAGASFIPLAANPGGAGNSNIEITSIDVARVGSSYIIAVGTRDSDSLEFGGVYILDESEPLADWFDTNLGSYDVYAVAFSPNFTIDQQLVAVVTDETDTIATTMIGFGWGQIIGDATIPISDVIGADIAFPDDYNATAEDYVQFIAVDTGSDTGDVYMIIGLEVPDSSVAIDLNIGSIYGLSNVDVTTLAVTGDAVAANLLAGAAGSAQVYFSTDGGINWARSTKAPTGGSKTYVLMAPDFISSGKAYAATSGTESAFSYTTDGGVTWNQLSLIDTIISSIIGLAPSPNYSQDNTLFMLTGKTVSPMSQSLWHSLNGGARWERVFTSTLANVDSIDRIELSPRYGNGSRVIFIAGSSNSNPVIWKSTDNGQSFIPRIAPLPINRWAVVDDNTLFIGGYDGSNGIVYYTTNSGWTYSSGTVAGSHPLNSIVLSPNYEEDETILVGNINGWVYWSNDNGTSFEPLPLDATSPPLTGKITVAFDPDYSHNNTIYAASETTNKGIYRFKIGTSTEWESIDATLPDGGMINQLMVSAEGTLYATNSKADGGMERGLNPTNSLFETVTRGLDDGVKLSGLWLYGNQLWSIDTANTRLMTYIDTLTVPVILTSPPNKGAGIGTIIDYSIGDISLDWEALKGATEYEWQLDYDTDFSDAYEGFEGDTRVSSARLPSLKLATTYYWRVRATNPMLSPWSAKWSFTTSLGAEIIAPRLTSPEAGASRVPLKPVFQWSAIAGADSYELLVSTDISFVDPIIIKVGAYALPTTAWQSDINLDYDTTYYWQVRATGSNSYSAWSAVSAFTTELPQAESSLPAEPSPPTESPPAPPPTTPDWVMWLMYLGGGLLLIMLATLITVIILTVRLWRL